METLNTADVLRARIQFWRRGNQRIALVPTMGNLHAGHLQLVERARQMAERVVVSSFVNPLQFGPQEDFATYPRTLEADQAALDQLGVDLVFTPAVDEMYPEGLERATRVEVPGLSGRLCGVQRPGFFVGVATVVAKLFNLVQPDTALFGEKDYQQLLVIRRLVADLCFPIDIVGIDTVRETDGLAMSSRNQYLSAEERAQAPELYRVLQDMADQLRRGQGDIPRLEEDATLRLSRLGFEPEYVQVLQADDLELPAKPGAELVILAAAKLGKARLIDNLRV